jgi:wyosine [tRNA(Phe)-imidazoG37] synthetase (radical SAM superfamily)
MLIDGINCTVNNITNVSELIKRINPEKAYLAIPIRPPSEESVNPPDSEKLNMAWQIFNNNHIYTEFLTGFEGTDAGFTGNIYDDILNITAVHPLRQDSLIRLLHNDNADISVVKSLIKQRLIRSTIYNGNKYYLREYHLHI